MCSDFRLLRILRLAALVSLVLALANHLLPPKPYALTQLLFDYSQGVIPRGLFGAVLSWVWEGPVPRNLHHALAAAVTLIGALAFFVFMGRQCRDTEAGLRLWILALNSFAFAGFVGAVGYLDGLMLALAALALMLPAGWGGVVLKALCLAVGVALHELMLPFFGVAVAFDTWLRGGRQGVWKAAVLLALPGLVTLYLIGFRHLDAADADLVAARISARMQGGADPESLAVLGRGLMRHLSDMNGMRASGFYNVMLILDGIPLALMAGWLFWLGRRIAGPDARMVHLGLVAVVLVPLAPNLVAFDIVRFGVASVLSGFLAIAILLRARPEAGPRLGVSLGWGTFTLLLVLNANIFVTAINLGTAHDAQAPWVLRHHLGWMTPGP